MKQKGWIIYNGHLPGRKFIDFAEWLQEAGKRRNIDMKIIKNNHLLASLSGQGPALVQLECQELPDVVLFGDKDIFLARQLEMMGVPVYNSAETIEFCDNKIVTYQKAAEKKLPIPRTVIAPKIFSGAEAVEMESFHEAAGQLGFPLVVKEAYGSFGEQVYLIHSKQELEMKVNALKNRPFLMQELIHSSYGRDLRLNVVGDHVVAAMSRTSRDDFRANVSAGGKMESYSPSRLEEETAIQAAKAVNADFAGVDLLFGPDGPVVCEINSNAHIRNIFTCTGINVADFIIDYVINDREKRGK